MEYNNEQLHRLANELNFLIGNKVKSSETEFLTITSIEVVPQEHSLRFFFKEGLPHKVYLYMWLDNFIEYNPEYEHLLPK
jgi:hypothetical protein